MRKARLVLATDGRERKDWRSAWGFAKRLPRPAGAAPILVVTMLLAIGIANAQESQNQSYLAVDFDGRFGQVEVGGPWVGAEFHHSRPLPSRISFYYPVANSIDLSTDYWRRGDSLPLNFILHHEGQVDSLGAESWPYRYTPSSVEFEEAKAAYSCRISYRFCQNLPVMVLSLNLINSGKVAQLFQLESDLQCLLRTCQTYAEKRPVRITHAAQNIMQAASADGDLAAAVFDSPETDSALVFVINAGEAGRPVSSNGSIAFHYEKKLLPGERWQIIQLIGSCRQDEARALTSRAAKEWQNECDNLEQSIFAYANDRGLMLPDSALMQTARWSKAVLAGNRHYLDGKIVPMPCPAEYNFFFTHDLLLTDLGAVNFDCERVRKDLLYLRSLTKADSILAHAYYWRDSGFQTEFCTSDNWNHLWFIILTASYLRHSGDSSTVRSLTPILHKSLQMMLENKGADDLMYAWRPDWWDIGHLYGARAYITTLMIRTLREYSYIGLRLGYDEGQLAGDLILAERMQQRLETELWDEKSGFLLNRLEAGKVDHHYYAGSLLAAAWKVLDKSKSATLLKTAANELLDRNLGIRIAMPADFHQLIDLYHFNGDEAGAPYLYINGGIWPHGIVWYALGWLAIGEADSARNILKRYLTLEGIRKSPGGQPSFFEYRNADAASPRYGEIDKPTFLWAGGWYLHAIYQLAGLRENEWNLALAPNLPQDWKELDYELMADGRRQRVVIKGQGAWFKAIRGDGQLLHSAVITQPAGIMVLERGVPETPYLAAATCMVERVQFFERSGVLQIDVMGLPGQSVEMRVVSPFPPGRLYKGLEGVEFSRSGTVYEIVMHLKLKDRAESIELQFSRNPGAGSPKLE